MKISKSIVTLAAVAGFTFLGTSVASANTNYTVKSGDSLWAISQNYGTSVNAIVNANPKLSSMNDYIFPGNILSIPTSGNYSYSSQQTYSAPKSSYQAPTANQSQSSTNYTQSTQTSSQSNYGASTGSVAQQAAQAMQANTGVSASTWMRIMQHESLSAGGVTAQNPNSSAHGLFQSLYTTSNDWHVQVQDATRLYKNGGLAHWNGAY